MRKMLTGAALLVATLLVATNPVVVEAAAQITGKQIKNETIKSKDIKNNQVKSVDIKDGGVGTVDLAADARGAKVYRYPVDGGKNFAVDPLLCVTLPVTAAEIRSSSWSATMESGGEVVPIGSWGVGSASQYRVQVEPLSSQGCIAKVSGPGESYVGISFFRTATTTVGSELTQQIRPDRRG